MRTHFVLFMLAATLPVFADQQAPPSKGPSTTKDSLETKALTLTGCIAAAEGDDQLRLADRENGTYRLNGSNLRRYLGKRVQVSGFRLGGLNVAGGLVPSPNAAAQAGALDPAQAATAALPGGVAQTTQGTPVVEFQVKKVQPVKGSCP
jgi:hypothetical protein